MSPLHAVRVELDFFTPSVTRMTIYFPAYVVASDYNLNLGTISLGTTETTTVGDLSVVLVGNQIFSGHLLPVYSNVIALMLPPTLLVPFASAIKNGTLYFRPSESYLNYLDGSAVTMSLNPLPMVIVYDGL